MSKPAPTKGMHHLALFCENLEQCRDFYVDLVGMSIEWQPDDDNIYLTSGTDNLALHRAPKDFEAAEQQRLDHFGFIIAKKDQVNDWHHYLADNGVDMKTKVLDHRDGARSFYCSDPEGNTVQFIYHPPLCD